jgi:hypothetical protein
VGTSQTPRNPEPQDAAAALLQLGRLSLRELSMESLLQTVADLAATALPGDLEASVTLLVKGLPSTVASTGPLALDLDEAQYEQDHGPCLHAARTGEATEIADTRRRPANRNELHHRAGRHPGSGVRTHGDCLPQLLLDVVNAGPQSAGSGLLLVGAQPARRAGAGHGRSVVVSSASRPPARAAC